MGSSTTGGQIYSSESFEHFTCQRPSVNIKHTFRQTQTDRQIDIQTSLHYNIYLQTQISNEAKTILSLDPSERTEDQLHIALLALNAAVEAFSEFPITMQRSLVRVGWYEQ